MFLFALVATYSPVLIFTQQFEIDQFRPNADVDMSAELFNTSKCERLDSEGVTCKNMFTRVFGVQPKASSIRIYNRKISKIYFSGARSDFPSLNRVLTMTYGKPCKIQQIALASRSEKQKLSSLQQSWCLPTGLLTLTERSYLSDNFSFAYEDHFNKRPRLWFKTIEYRLMSILGAEMDQEGL